MHTMREISGNLGIPSLSCAIIITMQTRSRSSKSPPSSEGNVDPASNVQHASNVQSKAIWTDDDDAAMIQFFLQKKGTMTANAMFKQPVFEEVARLLNNSCQKGGKKSFSSCRSRWIKVCIPFIRVLPVP